MNKKIKVIDLVNIIVNKQDIPQRIRVDKDIYNWDIEEFYKREDGNDLFDLANSYITKRFLELEVEILKDNTEEIEGLKYEVQNLFDDKGNILETQFILRDEDVIKTINDLVNAVNKMKEGKE